MADKLLAIMRREGTTIAALFGLSYVIVWRRTMGVWRIAGLGM